MRVGHIALFAAPSSSSRRSRAGERDSKPFNGLRLSADYPFPENFLHTVSGESPIMAWSTIRPATSIDHSNLQRAAVRFCNRHGIQFERESSCVSEIESIVWMTDASCGYDIQDTARRLRPLWARIVKRTLGSNLAQGIAYGHVGYHVD